MIRLVALACGLICGAGMTISGLYDPSLLLVFVTPQSMLSPVLGIALFCAILVAVVVTAFGGKRNAPLLGGELAPVPVKLGWASLMGALLFGLGWGLSGYFPLAAMVSAGFFSGGAAIFLISALGGLAIMGLIMAGGVQRPTRGRSRG